MTHGWAERVTLGNMRFVAVLLVLCACAAAQAPAARPNPAPHAPVYCNHDLGFCFDYPSSWKVLGEVYDGHGVSLAPPQDGDPSQWANVTVAALEIPQTEGKNPPTVEDLVTSLVGKMAEQAQNMETVRRSDERLAHHPAQLLQVRYDENGKRWGETIVALDGENGSFFTIVYKARVADEAKYQAQVQAILRSFRLTS